MEILAPAWKSYLRIVVPRKASREQKHATELAFYAGAIHVLDVMKKISSNEVTEEQGVVLLHAMHLEAELYKRKRNKVDPGAN